MDSSNPMAWVVKKAKLNSKKFFWNTLIMKLKCLAIGYKEGSSQSSGERHFCPYTLFIKHQDNHAEAHFTVD